MNNPQPQEVNPFHALLFRFSVVAEKAAKLVNVHRGKSLLPSQPERVS